MDLKAISWVGNIYEKFETMCLEMEEAMYQVNIILSNIVLYFPFNYYIYLILLVFWFVLEVICL